MAFKKGVNSRTGEPVEKTVEAEEVAKEEPRNMQIMVKGTKEIRCIKKSEYDYRNHIAL